MAFWKFTKGVTKHESVFSLNTLKWTFKYTVTDIFLSLFILLTSCLLACILIEYWLFIRLIKHILMVILDHMDHILDPLHN